MKTSKINWNYVGVGLSSVYHKKSYTKNFILGEQADRQINR